MNGLRINISESDFKIKPTSDQNWMLYQAITKIDQQGCSWASNRYRENIWKKLTVLGAGVGGGFGFSILVGKAFGWW